MNVLFDTNIILDVLLDRDPFADNASCLLAQVEHSEIIGFACATTITMIHYLIAKALGRKRAVRHIDDLLSLFVIAPVNHLVLAEALKSGFKDFEDAVLHASALHAGVQYIVTRNCRDFPEAKLPVCTPPELIAILNSAKP